MDFDELLSVFLQHRDPLKADGMKAYMRGQFEFLGIATPLRRTLTKGHYAQAKKLPHVDWDFVDRCWDCKFRELQYVAVGYLQAVTDQLSDRDIPALKNLVTRKSWWDTIDGLDRVVGAIALKDPQLNDVLLEWSQDPNMWVRRVAIDHQLPRKTRTDTELLARIIINNFGDKEFFINKAIGWALREYSKTDPQWVRDFIEQHRDNMAALSIREASKYI